MITPALEILNQKGTPMFNSDLFANRPAAGIEGRIFIATDTRQLYRDTGSTWELLSAGSGGTITGSGTATQVAFWNSASSLTGTNNLFWDATNNRLGINTNTPGVSLDVHGTNVIAQLNGTGTTNAQVTFQNAGTNKWQIGNIYSGGSNYFRIQDNASSVERIKLENTGSLFLTGYLENLRTSTASASSGWHGFYSTENITIPAGTSFNNVGNIFAGLVSRNTMFYDGSASFAQANLTASVSANNIFNFNAAGSTITISQATGTRAYGAVTAFNWINSTNSGTITHLAGFHNLAPYQGSTGILNVTNYYGLLLNSSTERTAFTITNKWGIYQEGSSDLNYFASRVLIGSNVDDGNKLQVTGTSNLNGFVGIRNSNPQSLIDAVGQSGQLAEIKVTATGGGNPRLRLIGSGLNDCQIYYNYNLNIFASNTSVSALQLADTGAATFSGELRVYPSSGTAILRFGSGGVEKGKISADASGNMVFEAAGNTALTIASSLAATFSSSVTAVGTFNLQRSGAGANTTFQFKNELGNNRAKILFGGANEELGFYSGDGSTANLIIASTGNVGIGVTPSAWFSSSKVVQVSNAALEGRTNVMQLWSNGYVDAAGSGNYYIGNGYATKYTQFNGEHQFFTAPSGTAGNAISFTQAMTLNAAGRLLLGTQTDNGTDLLQVAGSVRTTGSITTIGTSSSKVVMWSNFSGGNSGLSLFNTSGTENIYLNSANGRILSTDIQTAAPSGGTAQPFKMGSYVGGVTAGTGYVQIEINGTTYKLIAST